MRGLECEANVRVGRVLVLRPLEWPNTEVSDRCQTDVFHQPRTMPAHKDTLKVEELSV